MLIMWDIEKDGTDDVAKGPSQGPQNSGLAAIFLL